MHEPDGIPVAEDAGDAGGGILAHRMPDQCRRADAALHPKPRKRHLDDQDRRQLARGKQEPLPGVIVRQRPAKPDLANFGFRLCGQVAKPLIHMRPEIRIALVKIARHARMLRPSPRKQKHDFSRTVDAPVGEGVAGVGLRQGLHGVIAVAHGDDAAMLELPAAGMKRVNGIAKRKPGLRGERCAEPRSHVVQRLRLLRRQRDQHGFFVHSLALRVDRPMRRFLEDHVRVGAPDAQRIDRRAPRPAGHRPGSQAGIDEERAGVEGDGRIGRLEAERGRDFAMFERKRDLDQADDAGRRVEMADIGLDRADRAKTAPIGVLAKGLRQRLDLDRIAERGAGAVALDIVDRLGVDAGKPLCLDDGFGLAVDAGREISGLAGAVIVDGRALDDGVDAVAIGYGVGEAAQDDDACSAAEDRAASAMVERPAMPVRRQDFAFLEEIAAPMRKLDGDAAGKRHVAFARNQALAGIMRGDQRGRTGGLDVDARPAQVEGKGDARRQEVLVVAVVAQQEHPDLLDELPVAADVEIEIAAHATAGKDADGTRDRVRRVPRILHRLPRALQKLAVLGVHDRRFLRTEAEEIRVEHLHVGHVRGPAHIMRIIDRCAVGGGGRDFLGRQVADGFDAVADVRPEALDIACPRRTQRHPHDGNVVRRDCGWRRIHVHLGIPTGSAGRARATTRTLEANLPVVTVLLQ